MNRKRCKNIIDNNNYIDRNNIEMGIPLKNENFLLF